MKSLLLIISDEVTKTIIENALSEEYHLLIAVKWEEGLAVLCEKRGELSAVLVDLNLALCNGHDFAKKLMGDDPFSLLPIIGVTREISEIPNLNYLDYGVFDVITRKTPPRLMLRRIQSAVNTVDSISFHELERLLKVLPITIYLKNAEGRYVFSTHYWHHFYHADEPGWSIRGKTDLDIRKDKENALKAMETDRMILSSGEGMEYIIEEDADGITEYLELVKLPVIGENGKVDGIVALVNNVTEKQLLKMELEKRAQVDLLTELLNKATTEELIRMRLNFGQKNNQRGALIMLDVDNFKSVNDCCGHTAGDRVLSSIGHVIRNSFRGMDVSGRVGGDEFMIYAQNISSGADAISLAERIGAQITNTVSEYHATVSVGVALFPDHGTTFEELYRAADTALYQVKRNGKATCMLYDPNP